MKKTRFGINTGFLEIVLPDKRKNEDENMIALAGEI